MEDGADGAVEGEVEGEVEGARARTGWAASATATNPTTRTARTEGIRVNLGIVQRFLSS